MTAPCIHGLDTRRPAGNAPAARWRELSPALGRLAECPRFVAAAAEDYWLDWHRPWWSVPDLLGDEEPAWAAVESAAPELAEFVGDPVPAEAGAEAEYRRRCRCAAVRTAAAAAGMVTTTYHFSPHLGGEAAFSLRVGPATVRIGQVADCEAEATPQQIDTVCGWLRSDGFLRRLEAAYCPFLGDEENFSRHLARWRAWEPLRRWQSRHPGPATLVPPAGDSVIPGYAWRYSADDLPATDIPFGTAATLVAPAAADCLEALRRHPLLDTGAPPELALVDWVLERRRTALEAGFSPSH